MTKDVQVARIDVEAGKTQQKTDAVAKEAPLHVFLGSFHLVSILASPSLLKELIVGHLLSEAFVKSLTEIKSLDFDDENRCFVTLRTEDPQRVIALSKPYSRLIVSACSGANYTSLPQVLNQLALKPLPSLTIAAPTILDCVRRLNTLANVFRSTGGVHVAALYSLRGRLRALAEDVGRHNAVDKAIGVGALKGEEFGQRFLALSGRLTGDIVLKVARVGIPVVASLAGAVDSGVDVAEQTGVTLVGFVRGHRMNVYTHQERIRV